jgi:tetratricopeptide (TPR) repeat protein
MAFTYLPFRFRFTNEKGQKLGATPVRGVVDENGIHFEEDLLRFDDVYDILQEKNLLIFVLYKGLAVGRTITDHILRGTNTLVIAIPEDVAVHVRSVINKRYTAIQLENTELRMKMEGNLKHFRSVTCPNCEASLDLSYKADTKQIYCKHCEVIFTRYNFILPDTEKYTICPETGYYDRVQDYLDARFYFFGSKGGSEVKFETYHCADAVAERWLSEVAFKNVWFLFAIPFNLYTKFKLGAARQDLLRNISKANRYAQDGNITKAVILYDEMILRSDNYPPLFYNKAKMYLDQAEKFRASKNEAEQAQAPSMFNKAASMFRKALQECSNYIPATELMEQLGDIEVDRT